MSRRSRPGGPTVTAAWSAIGASVRGASHERTGLPNQDAHSVARPEGTDTGTVVAAVADGHGGQRYVRSDVGSRLAVGIAAEAAVELAADLGPEVQPEELRRRLLAELAPLVVERWRAAVLDHVAAAPFSPEERATAGVDPDLDPPISYGCTLVLALLAPTVVGLLQIGDGDALLVGVDGRVVDPVPGDERLVGGETTSLCLPDAASDARAAAVPADGQELVVLSSDGYGNSFASDEWRQDAGRGFLDAVRRDGLHAVEDRLPAWLAESAAASGDDVTVVVARRERSGPGAAASAPTATAASTSGSAERQKGAKGRGAGALVLVGVLALAIGALGGSLLARGEDSASEAAPVDSAVGTDGAAGGAGGAGGPESVPETTTTTTPPTGALASIMGDGKVITFSAVLGESEPVNPVVTYESDDVRPSTRAPLGYTSVEVVDGTVRVGTTRWSIGNEAVAVTVVDDVVWVLDTTDQIRPFDAEGQARRGAWERAQS